MSGNILISYSLRVALSLAVCIGFLAGEFLLTSLAVHAQVSGETDINVSEKTGDDRECAIAINPSNKDQLFALCNTSTAGLLAARSADGGHTWSFPNPNKTIADGTDPQIPMACCDPTLAWDTFGNLFIAYLAQSQQVVVVLISKDGGATFASLATFAAVWVDQPTVVVANTSSGVVLWIVWNQKNPDNSTQMRARGAVVQSQGVVDPFGPQQNILAPSGCTYGDVAIAPTGEVVQACQTSAVSGVASKIIVNIKGLGAGTFGPAITATSTNVDKIYYIPPQNWHGIAAQAGLAFDSHAQSAHFRRLYLVYTDAVIGNPDDTDIMLRFSDNNGASWSTPPIRVNDDPVGSDSAGNSIPTHSQFFPRIATDPISGNIRVCWFDTRNDPSNKAVQAFCSIATPAGAVPTFLPNEQISEGSSTSNSLGDFGDYSGLAYLDGVAHPLWADTSDSARRHGNPDGQFEAYTHRVTEEDCIDFNPGTAHAAQVQGRWKLVDGSMWMLDFDNKQSDALRSEEIVKHYNLDKQCFIGRPGPSFTYWLVDNQSAVGPIANEDCVAFNPSNVQANLINSAWTMVDGAHLLFTFSNETDALRAVQIVKRYGFNQSCFVDRPNPRMSYQRK